MYGVQCFPQSSMVALFQLAVQCVTTADKFLACAFRKMKPIILTTQRDAIHQRCESLQCIHLGLYVIRVRRRMRFHLVGLCKKLCAVACNIELL